ncbi:FRG domain-containing protein [Staphylococcus hominis]
MIYNTQTYKDLDNQFKTIYKNLFKFNKININITLNSEGDYFIEDIDTDFNDELSKQLDVSEIMKTIENVNEKILLDINVVKLFDVLKELFTVINNSSESHETYYRGQRDNWFIKPNLFRQDTDREFVNNYESIYYELSTQFPEEIEYIDIKDIINNKDNKSYIKRANQLALLQHYGFKTTLVDITSNPYIAILFMCANSKFSLRNGVIDVFLINKERDKEFNSLFIKTKHSKSNKRLKAQNGAFFCFDKVLQLGFDSIEPIQTIRINLNFKYNVPNVLVHETRKTGNIEYFEKMEKRLNDFIKDAKQTLKEKHFAKKKIRTDKDIELIKEYNLNLKTGDSYNKLFTIIKNNFNEEKMKIFLDEKQNFIAGIENIRTELIDTLEEYYYLEENLYPDLYNQTNFIVKKYLRDITKSVGINKNSM